MMICFMLRVVSHCERPEDLHRVATGGCPIGRKCIHCAVDALPVRRQDDNGTLT